MQFESALCVRFIRLSLHARKTHVRRGLAASFVGTGISPCCRVSAPTPAAATVASASTATTAAVADATTAATTAAVAVARHARGVSTSWPPCIAPATTVPLLGLSCGREPAHAGLGRQHCDAGARRARSRAGSLGGGGSGGGGSAARKHGAAAGPAPPPPPPTCRRLGRLPTRTVRFCARAVASADGPAEHAPSTTAAPERAARRPQRRSTTHARVHADLLSFNLQSTPLPPLPPRAPPRRLCVPHRARRAR